MDSQHWLCAALIKGLISAAQRLISAGFISWQRSGWGFWRKVFGGLVVWGYGIRGQRAEGCGVWSLCGAWWVWAGLLSGGWDLRREVSGLGFGHWALGRFGGGGRLWVP